MNYIDIIFKTRVETYIQYIIIKITLYLFQYKDIYTNAKYLRLIAFEFKNIFINIPFNAIISTSPTTFYS